MLLYFNEKVHGNWGSWEPWGSCSVTCANGTQTRTRLCDDPKPMFGGDNCTSNSSWTEMWNADNNTMEATDYQDCDEGPCPSKLLIHVAEISIVVPPICNTGKTTSIFKLFYAFNFNFNLQVNGNWGAWGNWSECSSTCIGGMQNRNRTCSDPSPQYGGLNCTASNSTTVTGDSMMETETITCNDIPCESDICKKNLKLIDGISLNFKLLVYQ